MGDEGETDRYRESEWRNLIDSEDWNGIEARLSGWEEGYVGEKSIHSEEWYRLLDAIGALATKKEFDKPPHLMSLMIDKLTPLSSSDEVKELYLSGFHNWGSRYGVCPYEALLKRFVDQFGQEEVARLIFDRAPHFGLNMLGNCILQPRPPLAFQFELAMEIIKVALADTTSDATLHRLLYPRCPNILVGLALSSLNKNEEVVHKMDKNGNLPLHVAAANPAFDEIFATRAMWRAEMLERYDEKTLEMDSTHAVAQLLDAYPQAASIPNQQGRFALNLMIEKCWICETEDAAKKEQSMINFPNQVGSVQLFTEAIMKLVNAAPKVLQARDAQTLLYPALLAATPESGCPLSLVYSLLREYPMVVLGQHCF